MQLSSAVIPSLVAALIYWVFFYVGENYNKSVWLCRRRLPEEQVLKRAETCLFPTGSVSHMLDQRKSLPCYYFFPWMVTEWGAARLTHKVKQSDTWFVFVSCSPKEPVPNGNSQTSEVKKTVCQKRALEDSDGAGETLSKNKQKKRSRNPNKNFSPEQKRELKRRKQLTRFLWKPARMTSTQFFLSPAAKYIKCEQCGNPKVKTELLICHQQE